MNVQLIPFILVVAAPFALYGLYLLYDARRIRRNRAAALGEAPAPRATGRAQRAAKSPSEPNFGGPTQPEPAFDADGGQGIPAGAGSDAARGGSAATPSQPAPTPATPSTTGTPATGQPGARPVSGGGSAPVFPDLSSADVLQDFYYLVRGTVPKGIKGATLLELAGKLAQSGRQANHQLFLGHDKGSWRWEKPRPDRSYRHFVWGVPLLGRDFELGQDDSAHYVRVFQGHMRQDKESNAEFPTADEIAQRKEMLVDFIKDANVTLNLYLIAAKKDGGKAQRCGDIIELASSLGLKELDGRLVRHVNGEVHFTLDTCLGDEPLCSSSQDRLIAKLHLCLDIPTVSQPAVALEDLLEVAGQFERVLELSVYEDEMAQGERVSEAHHTIFRGGVNNTVELMLAHGVQPGSTLARSLYN